MTSDNQQQNNNVNDLAFGDEIAQAAALKAMAARGVVDPERYLSLSSPTKALAWCRWWDEQKDVGPGLLVMKIRSGEDAPVDRSRPKGLQPGWTEGRRFPALERFVKDG